MQLNIRLDKKTIFIITIMMLVGVAYGISSRVNELGVTINLNVNRTTTTNTNITLYNVSSTYPANNVTNGTFGIGYVTRGNYTFPHDVTINNNLSILGNISATNITGSILCTQLVGGSDSNYCADATGAGGDPPTSYPADNITNGTFGARFVTNGNYTFPYNLVINRNVTIGDKIIGDGSLLNNLNATALVNGLVNTGLLAANVTELGQTIELGTETNWNGVTGLTFGNNVTFNGLSGLVLGTNVTWNGITIGQGNITGITIPASNVTNGTFSSLNGLVFIFPNNLTVTGNLSIDRLVSGWIPQSQITGITIPLVNASWNGVTGLTFIDNITGQLPQSRISGITIPLTNVTYAESTARYNFTANQTYKISSGNNAICTELVLGTAVNYSKCWNGTVMTEQIGVFVLP